MEKTTVILTADVGVEWSRSDYEAWTDFVGERLPAKVANAEIEIRPYGEPESRQYRGTAADAAREAVESLWAEWCATGWDAWRAAQSAEYWVSVYEGQHAPGRTYKLTSHSLEAARKEAALLLEGCYRGQGRVEVRTADPAIAESDAALVLWAE